MESTTDLGFTVALHTDYESVIMQVTEALKNEGFGVLTEIDVKATLKKKLDIEFRPYKILGACNPSLAYRALTIAPETGLLLPCNVTVAQAEGGVVEVSLVNPMAMLGAAAHPTLESIASEAQERLARVAAALQRH